MKRFFTIMRYLYITLTSIVVLVCLSSATYAWFSSNSVVKTDFVVGASGVDQVVLQVSQAGGDSFSGSEETSLVQVNKTDSRNLLPVSTTDLRNFVYSSSTVDKEAVYFLKVENENYYYHGRVYLQATAQGHSENARLALYLDGMDNNGSVVRNQKGIFANAARVGFLFDNGSAKILRVSESENPEGQRNLNAKLNGVELKAGQVIDSSADVLRTVDDPSEALSKYMVGAEGVAGNGVTPLLTMELNRVYQVDVFFYLEGCDPDCTDSTRMDELDFHLAFYGILTEGEDG